MGGTEATVIRISSGLAQRGHSVVVAQGARQTEELGDSRLVYTNFNIGEFPVLQAEPDVVVILNTPKLLPKARKAYPKAAMYLWVHCFPGKHRKKTLNQYATETNTTILAVSNILNVFVQDCLRRHPKYGPRSRNGGQLAQVKTIYNPVADELAPDARPVNPNKLVFFSSPHKGLDQVLRAFSIVRKEWPELRLYLANPGYWPMPEGYSGEAVEVLGSLRHAEVIEHVREAFCVFYPQSAFRETFGLVFAEANAVGTPVITHDVGAAGEILQQKVQLVDARNPAHVAATIRKWKESGRPRVFLAERFRLRRVLAAWEALLPRSKTLKAADDTAEIRSTGGYA